MTAFLLLDEFERDFEPLENEPARHAAAVAMYCLVGQKCAQRMTDGAIPSQVIGKTFAAWPKPMVSTAIADLVALVKWEQGEDALLRFVDWDLTQFTRDQEVARREKHAKRNRDYRVRVKARESGAVTHHATHHEDRHVTVPSPSPSSSPDPLPTTSLREVTKTPRLRSGAPEGASPGDVAKVRRSKAKSAALASLETALKKELGKRNEVAPALSQSLGAKAAKRVAEYAELNSVTLEASAELLAASWAAYGGGSAWKLCDVSFRLEHASQGRSGRPTRARGTTGEDFADVPSVEEQMRQKGWIE